MADDIAGELEMVFSMFSDECERGPSSRSLVVHLPFRFVMQIELPSTGYPHERYPQIIVDAGPNVQLIGAFSHEIYRRMRETIPLGFPMLASVIPLAQQIAEEMKDAKTEHERDERESGEVLEQAMQRHAEALQTTSMDVWSGVPIVDRKSKFVCHMAAVRSEDDVRSVVHYLRCQKHIADAAHPTIWAYRFTDGDGVLHKDCDDDGEHGASTKMMFLLDKLQVDGYVIVVTRWFGGILLGPDRFKHIMEVSRNMLLTIPQRKGCQ